MVYITNVDLVKDNKYAKSDLILSIRSQDIERKSNSDMNQGPKLCCKFAKKTKVFTIPMLKVNGDEHKDWSYSVNLFSRKNKF